ncbi:Anoctamin-2 [Manis pentadactyla]|nr:Anoctamin-2 [Manis pentadactyla]
MEGTLRISSWGLVPTVCTAPHQGGPPHWSSCLELPLTSQAAQPRPQEEGGVDREPLTKDRGHHSGSSQRGWGVMVGISYC